MKIFLDDERDPLHVTWIELPKSPWFICRTYHQFITLVETNGERITHISFDHDLGPGESGYDCAKFLVEWCIDNQHQLPSWTVHSMNPVGAKNINEYLENFRRVNGC